MTVNVLTQKTVNEMRAMTETFEKVFFTDDCPKAFRDGMFYRTMGLGKFIKDCESKGYQIVGIRLTEENNGELLFVQHDVK